MRVKRVFVVSMVFLLGVGLSGYGMTERKVDPSTMQKTTQTT